MDVEARTRELDTVLDHAIEEYQHSRPDSAYAICHDVLDRDPNEPGALNLLAVMALAQQAPSHSLTLVDRAITQDTEQPRLHNTRAQALTALGRLDEARAAYLQAWSLRPGSPAIANNLGCLMRMNGNLEEAAGWFGVALEAEPTSAAIAVNLAAALTEAREFSKADQAFKQALKWRPACPSIVNQHAAMLLAWGRPEAAENTLQAARLRHPRHGPTLHNLALALDQRQRPDLAIGLLREALLQDPNCADSNAELGRLLLLDSRQDEARACYDRALAIDPLHGRALWGRCMVELPVLYESTPEIPRQRRRYRRALDHLRRIAAGPAVASNLSQAAGSLSPVFLPYQGRPDLSLQERYGGLLASLRAAPFDPPMPPALGEPIRLGIVSGFFCDHPVWSLMLRGWLSEIDRTRFEVTAYHTAPADDAQTRMARILCPRFVNGPAALVREAILRDRPQILLYPEFGLDAAAAQLAAERLAPIQAMAWGQPGTTGLPTMDIFFSSAWMEPPGAASHYSERLVTLPKLGTHYAADHRRVARVSRADINVRETATLYWCPQNLSKYLPQHDDVLPRIAGQVEDCQFVFIASPRSQTVTDRFYDRLCRAFQARGLDPTHYLVMLPAMPHPRFLGVTELADIVLDSIGWSGGKSTLDMLAVAPVIVTLPGPLMRGRQTAGILNGIGVTETVAETEDDYIAIAARLARSRTARYAIRRAMRAGRRRILSDAMPIRAMENVLIQAVLS